MDTTAHLGPLPQDQEAQRAKYALLRPSVPLGSECLVRVFFLDTLGTAQQMVLATTVPVVARPESQRRDSARRRSLSGPAAAEHPAGGSSPPSPWHPTTSTPRQGAGISSTALSGVVYGCPAVQARQGPRNWHTASVHDTAWPRLSPSLGNWSEWRIRAIWRV